MEKSLIRCAQYMAGCGAEDKTCDAPPDEVTTTSKRHITDPCGNSCQANLKEAQSGVLSNCSGRGVGVPRTPSRRGSRECSKTCRWSSRAKMTDDAAMIRGVSTRIGGTGADDDETVRMIDDIPSGSVNCGVSASILLCGAESFFL